jgi:hypothetical protein
MYIVAGDMSVIGSVAYASQHAWIQNMTVYAIGTRQGNLADVAPLKLNS